MGSELSLESILSSCNESKEMADLIYSSWFTTKVIFKDHNSILKCSILCDYFGLKKTCIYIGEY